VSDFETADFMSKYIGEQEIERAIESSSRSSNSLSVADTHSTSTQQQIVTQRAVLPSQLQQLPDMEGYFNLAGPTPVAYVELELAQTRKQAPAFIPRKPHERQILQPQQEQAQESKQQQNYLGNENFL
jgi:type IV secretory pathway TraG/TraD family ATPase VirD4